MTDREAAPAAVAAALAEGRIAPTETGRPADEAGAGKSSAALAELSLRRLTASCYILGG